MRFLQAGVGPSYVEDVEVIYIYNITDCCTALIDKVELREERRMSFTFTLQLYLYVRQRKVVKKLSTPLVLLLVIFVLTILKNVCCVLNSSTFPVMSCFKRTQQRPIKLTICAPIHSIIIISSYYPNFHTSLIQYQNDFL